MTDTSIDNLVRMLGGWPDFFKSGEIGHGRALLAQLVRDRMIDEAVFGMVVRYATYRAKWDELSADLLKAECDVKADGANLSAKEQQRAFYENKIKDLEKALIVTPMDRVRRLDTAQTSFMDLLVKPDAPKGGGTVTPFQPLTRGGTRG